MTPTKLKEVLVGVFDVPTLLLPLLPVLFWSWSPPLGPPNLHAEPRGLAAEALGAIGGARATQALLEFGPAAVGPLIESLGRRRVREEQEEVLRLRAPLGARA